MVVVEVVVVRLPVFVVDVVSGGQQSMGVNKKGSGGRGILTFVIHPQVAWMNLGVCPAACISISFRIDFV